MRDQICDFISYTVLVAVL